MAWRNPIVTFTALAAAGVGLGVHLGRAAVAEINPVYFSYSVEPRFFADLTPAGYRAGEAYDPATVDPWSVDPVVTGPDYCAACETVEVDEAYAVRPEIDPADEAAAAPPPEAAGAASETIERYSRFPVTRAEAQLAAGPQPAASAAAWEPTGM